MASTDAAPSPVPTLFTRPESLRTAYVRTWKPITNIADVYVMIRALERKYGKIIEVHFLKDFEVPLNYQAISWVIFQDSKSLQRVPEKGFDFSIPASGLKKEHHEIGLEDIERFAQEGDYEEGFELVPVDPESNQEVIGGRIIRADTDFIAENVNHRLHQATASVVLRAFLQWGGFAKLMPLDASRAINEHELFDGKTETELDSLRMRAALQLAAAATGSENPAVRRSKSSAPTQTSSSSSTGKDDPSFGSTVFGGLLSGENATTKAHVVADIPSPDPSIPENPTSSPPPPPPPPPPLSSSSPSSPSASQLASLTPTPKKSPPTREQIAEKEALERQLQVARQLRERVSPARQKQAKPPLRTPKLSSRARPALPEEPKFFEREEVVAERVEESKPGVLGRLWGMIGRK